MSVSGTVLVERYRLEERLTGPDPVQGSLWRAVDVLAGDIPVAIRQVESSPSRERLQRLWPSLQSLLHPQLPRCGELLECEGSLWTVRDWQEGSTFAQVLMQRSERQMVFSPGEVLLLLRQILPVLAVLHGRGLVHGDLNPRNLMRRSADGLPVLLDFGLVQASGDQPLEGASPGYAPRAQGRAEAAAAWMDCHGMGVTALVLLSGRAPDDLITKDGLGWTWPEGVELDSTFREVIERLLNEDPNRRLENAAAVLQALKPVPMPQETGPVARADRTVVLAPQAEPAAGAVPGAALAVGPVTVEPALPALATSSDPVVRRRTRAEERDQGAEGRLLPVVIALALSALVGSAIGWFLLSRNVSRGTAPSTERDVVGQQNSVSLPPAEVDDRQQLLSRLRALQVDSSWFIRLVDSSLLSRFPERGGRLPSDSLEDAPLRKVWNDLAEEWLARIEQLPPPLRARLGGLRNGDWTTAQDKLVKQGVHPRVVEQLVSAGARDLLPGDAQGRQPSEPHRQLWYAAAMQSLKGVSLETISARPRTASTRSLRIPPGSARLISVTVPSGYGLVLGINGTPLMQMTVFGADGQVEAERGPLRVARLSAAAGSPVQVLVTNEGVASGAITLSCRADRPQIEQPLTQPTRRRRPLPSVDPDPLPDSATGEPVRPEPVRSEPRRGDSAVNDDQDQRSAADSETLFSPDSDPLD
ncbi:MAG: serine/threonine protein kinase [Synechococcus sp. CPC35]|nr:serine/threonine protein kinase [Synechococcus sp. CPC35]